MRKKARITLVGVGSLGSFTALLIASMGFENIIAYDPDLVEYHNHRNQLYREGDFNKPKAEVLSQLINYLTPVKIVPVMALAGKGTKFSEVTIVMVDSMTARRNIFDEVKYNPRVKLYIDARSSGSYALVYAVNPCDPDGVKKYEENFYSDADAAQVACSDQTTLPTVWNVAAAAGQVLQLWSQGWTPVCEEVRLNYKELPGVDSEHLSI